MSNLTLLTKRQPRRAGSCPGTEPPQSQDLVKRGDCSISELDGASAECPHFTDRETDAQGGDVSDKDTGPGLIPQHLQGWLSRNLEGSPGALRNEPQTAGWGSENGN